MPPSVRFGRDEIVKAALDVVREEGVATLSARHVADKLGSSTAPIYSSFPSMEDLLKTVYAAGNERMLQYMGHKWTDAPFLNMGIGMTLLARDEPNIYKMLNFETPPFEVPQGEQERYVDLMVKDPMFSEIPREQLLPLLQDMTIVTHGLASFVCTGQMQEVTVEWVADWLGRIGGSVIAFRFHLEALGLTQERVEPRHTILNTEPPPPPGSSDNTQD